MEMQQIIEMLKAMQEKADANTRVMREDMKANRERAEAKNKAWRERFDTIWQADQEKTDIKLKELTETVEKTQMELQTADVLYGIPADTTYEKTDPNQGMMQSTEEHQEIPKGEAAVMLVGELRKQHRVRNLAAERRQKQKERIRTSCESKRRSTTPAGRCPAMQKWHCEKGTSSGLFRPKEIVDCERDW
jgi:hypothetical protein